MVASAVLASAWFSALRGVFTTWLSHFATQWEIPQYAWCAEVSPTTLRTPSVQARVHFHIALRGTLPALTCFFFRNALSRDFPSDCVSCCRRPSARGLPWFAMLFFTCKLPRRVVWTEVEMSRCLRIISCSLTGCFSWLQGEKITVAVARSLSVHCVRNLHSMLRTLAAFESASAEQALEAHVRAVQSEIASRMCPFRHIDVVSEWLAEFYAPCPRYRFLILDGPSCVGKTQFACSLASWGSVFFCDCQGATQPELRSFRPLHDEVIVMDEAPPSFVIRNKRLFQAPAEWVQLGFSATNMYSYRQWTHRANIVICCNDWTAGLQLFTAQEESVSCAQLPMLSESRCEKALQTMARAASGLSCRGRICGNNCMDFFPLQMLQGCRMYNLKIFLPSVVCIRVSTRIACRLAQACLRPVFRTRLRSRSYVPWQIPLKLHRGMRRPRFL